MLTDDDKKRIGSRTRREVDRLEQELIQLAADNIAGLDDLTSYEVTSRFGSVSVEASKVARKRRQSVMSAIEQDLREEFDLNAQREAEIARKAGSSIKKTVLSAATSESLRIAYRAAAETASSIISGCATDTLRAYIVACESAAQRVSVVGTRDALKSAVRILAESGITHSTYTQDGRTVRVPVDVGIRRAMVNAGQRGRMSQTLAIADAVGHDLVEVSVTANPRASHAEWQGQIYSLSGKDKDHKQFQSSCNVGDPVDGIGGYNCGHEVAMYYPEYGKTFSDPLAGTGYTHEQVRRLTDEQRRLERGIRADKRAAQTLSASGFDASDARASVRAKQAQLRELIANNESVLYRQPQREQTYGI